MLSSTMIRVTDTFFLCAHLDDFLLALIANEHDATLAESARGVYVRDTFLLQGFGVDGTERGAAKYAKGAMDRSMQLGFEL